MKNPFKAVLIKGAIWIIKRTNKKEAALSAEQDEAVALAHSDIEAIQVGTDMIRKERDSLAALVVRLKEALSVEQNCDEQCRTDWSAFDEALSLVPADLASKVLVERIEHAMSKLDRESIKECSSILLLADESPSLLPDKIRSMQQCLLSEKQAKVARGEEAEDFRIANAALEAEKSEAVKHICTLVKRGEALEADNRALREEIECHNKMEDTRFQVLPEPKNPTLWKYINESCKHGVIDFHLRAERMADGGFKFYIHAAQASSSTEDFYIWPDPFSWHDMVANTKDIPEPDIEAFKKSLRKTLAPKEGK